MANSPICNELPPPSSLDTIIPDSLYYLSHLTTTPPNIEQPHYTPHSSDNHPNTYTQQSFQFPCYLQSPTH